MQGVPTVKRDRFRNNNDGRFIHRAFDQVTTLRIMTAGFLISDKEINRLKKNPGVVD